MPLPATVTFTPDMKTIWNKLKQLQLSDYGAAGFLACMYAVSECYSYKLEGASSTECAEYASRVNNIGNSVSNPISKQAFISDYKGYGLVQWRDPGRKGNLYDKTKGSNKSIGDLNSQLNFIEWELTTWASNLYDSLKTADSIFSMLTPDCKFYFPLIEAYDIPDMIIDQYGGSIYAKYVLEAKFEESRNLINNLIAIAKGEYNARITEYPAGSNKVKYNTWFYGYEVEGSSYPWCMTFVQWCLNRAGIKVDRSASCSYLWNVTDPKCRVTNLKSLQPGDICLFDTPSKNSTNDHVGIVVEKINDTTYKTIEGNTSYDDGGSQANGGAVALRTRYTYGSFPIGRALRLLESDGTGGSYYLDTSYEERVSNYLQNKADYYKNVLDGEIQYKTGGPTTESGSRAIEYLTKQVDVKVTTLNTANADANITRVSGTHLLTTPTFVESPFIILKVGDYTFGSWTQKNSIQRANSIATVTYPNYMTSIDITKINGTVNQYTIQMVYQIEAGNDPNLLDKIFSKIGYGIVYISYGDWNSPKFKYKEEEAIITNLTSKIDFANSRINYTLKCTSNSLSLVGGYYNFPARKAKPSTIITEMLYQQEGTYHLRSTFLGMNYESKVNSAGLIPHDDAEVQLEAKPGMDALSYVNYLVSCMTSVVDKNYGLRRSNYYLTIHDDVTGEFGGSYFKITKVMADANALALDTYDTYEVDIGYPGDELVTNFNINTDNSWSLLYNYSQDVLQDNYSYNIDNEGNVTQTASPSILLSSKYGRVTETQRNWWSQMTQFPITATLELKGLLRPTMLMTYLRVNAFFYGQRHVSSGLYIITGQQDKIDSRGYRTTLSLTRIAGDLDTFSTDIKTIDVSIPVYNYNSAWAHSGLNRDEYDQNVRDKYRARNS